MKRRPHLRGAASLLVSLGGFALVVACRPKDAPDSRDLPPPVMIASAREVVPPAAPFNATPVAELEGAASIDGKTPLEQATAYEASGQLWMARLVLEPKALGPEGTKEEAELLARICQGQSDAPCLEECGKKLGRKIAPDAGAASSAKTSQAVGVGGEQREPESDLARARDLVLKLKLDLARQVLEPKVLDGKATREETRLLKTVCEKQRDRMCVALCDSKLK